MGAGKMGCSVAVELMRRGCYVRLHDSALDELVRSGLCLSDLMFVEYCAEPIEDGLFRKLAAYCVGDEVITGMSVHDENWHAKYGKEGVASEAHYLDEMQAVKENRHAAGIAGHFKAAGISFGRADFTLVKGKVEVYEINTNPNCSNPKTVKSD